MMEREFAFQQQDFDFLAHFVKEHTGIILAEHKKNMVYSRLARRLRHLKIDRFDTYCHFLKHDQSGDEVGHLVNAITTNLTQFFREPHHFEHLEKEALPEIIKNSSANNESALRIWSAGCSSGAEPYSIAMVCEKLRESRKNLNYKILATDIDSNILRIGREASYPADSLSHIPPKYHSATIYNKNSSNFFISESIKENIYFNHLNLHHSWPMKGLFDVIFCRNVVIYFDKDTQRKLFSRFGDILKPNGWLYIGHSESLHKISDRFELHGRTIYRRIS